jgi:hypothetical protein
VNIEVKNSSKTLDRNRWNMPLLNIATLGSDMPEPGKTLEVSQAAMPAKVNQQVIKTRSFRRST